MNNRLFAKVMLMLAMCALIFGCLTGCGGDSKLNYSDAALWAFAETQDTEKAADVFFVAPTVYSGSADSTNMPIDDEEWKSKFVGATNMEKGIYDDNARFFAPYYRQAGLYAYSVDEAERERCLSSAYEDVKLAFEYYLKDYNNDRPIILAGFSQGADLCIRLMKDYFDDEKLNERLVACYAIGWRLTEAELKEYSHLRFATGETDTGVIIAFNTEAPEIDDSLMIPKGTKTLAINPLNWKTDSTPADKSQNLGACFTSYSGKIKTETPELTGAYIDETRGALKVTDVTAEDYGPGLDIFAPGIFHLYDYQFFYRNLEKNVGDRIAAFLN